MPEDPQSETMVLRFDGGDGSYFELEELDGGKVGVEVGGLGRFAGCALDSSEVLQLHDALSEIIMRSQG